MRITQRKECTWQKLHLKASNTTQKDGTRLHHLLGEPYACSCVLSHVWLFCDPMDCSPPGSSDRGISPAKILEWVAIISSRGSSPSRDQTCISCTGSGFFTTEPPGKPSFSLLSFNTDIRETAFCFASLGFCHCSLLVNTLKTTSTNWEGFSSNISSNFCNFLVSGALCLVKVIFIILTFSGTSGSVSM